MSIGETLAHARREAGLTVTEVSQRTRIRETIIAGIEADDYAACGGDFYARGHIRAIARVAGIDSEPLIEEYDAARRPPDETDEFPAPPPTGRRGRWGRGGGGAAYDSGPQRGGAEGSVAQGGDVTRGDSAGFGGSAFRSRGSGLGGWLGRGGRDRWEDDQRAGPDEPDQPEPETETERWPGLGWLGRGYRTDPDGWDAPPRQDGPDESYDQGPGQQGQEHRADRNEPGPGAWDDTGELEQAEPDQADPGTASRADWSDPDPIDPDHWDEQLAQDGPGQAAGDRPGNRAGWSAADPGDPDTREAESLGRGRPSGTGRPSGPGRRGRLGAWLGLGDRDGRRPWRGQMVTTWVVLAAVIGFAIYSFVFAAGHRGSATGSHRSHTLQAAARHHARHKTPSPSASPSATPTPAVPLRPASATAFGIGGTGRGDDAGQAGLAIDHNPATAWHSDWYTSARFGNLYAGTGLLVDMGHQVTIASARVTLGPARGADLALRVGNLPTLTGLHTAATASNAGGVVNLSPSSPVRGRYVLIWLTSLPRDSAGTYQANIFNIQLTGHP